MTFCDVTRLQKNWVSTYSVLCRLYYVYLIKTTQTYIKNHFGFNGLRFKCRHVDAFFALKFIMAWKYVLATWKLQDFWCRLANPRDFTLFDIDAERRSSPSARSASADILTSAKILVHSSKNLLFLMSYWLNCTNCSWQRIFVGLLLLLLLLYFPQSEFKVLYLIYYNYS